MYQYLFTFRTMTHAQKAAYVLRRMGIMTKLERAPNYTGVHGCTYALALSASDWMEAAGLLLRDGVYFDHIYRTDRNGNIVEQLR